MTRVELRNRILDALDEDSENPVFWSSAQINGLIDQGQEILAEETRALKRTHTIVRTPGAMLFSTHALGDDCLMPWRLYAPSFDRRLTAVHLTDLDAQHELWWDQMGTGDPWVWFPIAWDTYGIYPPSSTGGEVIQVNSLVWPSSLIDDGDTPEWPEADHDGLVLYGVYEGLMKRWDLSRATMMLAKFLE